MTNQTLSILEKHSNEEMDKVKLAGKCIEELTGGKYTVELERDFQGNQLALSRNIFYVSPEMEINETITLIEDYLTQLHIAEALA